MTNATAESGAYICECKGVRELFDVLSQKPDVTILEPLCHQPYGQTEFVIRDPNGYAVVFAEHD